MPKKASGSRSSNGASGSASSSGAAARDMGGGFKTLSVGAHYCYMRAHDGEDDRTMFLVNLPVDATERHVRVLFAGEAASKVEEVRMWKSRAVVEAEEEDGEEEEQKVANGRARGGKKDGKNAKATGKELVRKAPVVTPLPPLDPRHPHNFLPTSTSAHVTFADNAALQRALKTTHIHTWPDPFKQQRPQHNDTNQPVAKNGRLAPPSGLPFLLARHRALRPSHDVVRAHADSVMAHFTWRLSQAKRARKQATIEAVSVGPNGELLDADGFTIVQTTGKFGRTADGQGGSMRVARSRQSGGGRARGRGGDDDDEGEDGAPPSKKKKRLELDDFYRFQRREAKRQELADLRAKFQADQEKVKELKSSRNFKPF